MADQAPSDDMMYRLFGTPPYEEFHDDSAVFMNLSDNDNGYEFEDDRNHEAVEDEEEEQEEEQEEQEEEEEEADEMDECEMYEAEFDDCLYKGESAFEEMVKNGPKSGMIFYSESSMLAAYTAFAKAKGFGISCRSRSTTKYVQYLCERGRKSEGKKYSKRIGCPARLNAKNKGGDIWMVGKVCNDHNHELEPEMSVFMPSHRKLTPDMKVHLEAYDRSGVRVCKSIRMMEVLSGGPSNLGATGKDCRNHVDKIRRLRLGEGDAAAIQKLFKRLQQVDRDFFYLFDVDDNSRLRNVMWIHPRSRAAYQDFHDVVSFDTTYLVNQYNMPFGSVVGINQHNQSILLGCCLLTNETAESFKWFFSNWLEAMGGVHPTAILSEQDESIRIALREVMPASIHRLCIWHIVAKVKLKFKGISNLDELRSDFNAMIYDSVRISEFEAMWTAFQAKYGLQDHMWLKNLFEDRQNWVPVYSNHIFWAGMNSTQRSESMHAFFDHYINYRSTLKRFVEQYEIAVTEKFRKELGAQYLSKCRPIICMSNFKWEAQFARVYTNNIMVLIQKEIKQMWSCNVKLLAMVGGALERYEVSELGRLKHWYGKEYNFEVEYRPAGEYISCNCRKFESKGIFCCHIMKVLSYKNIKVVNERYVLGRWRKDVYRPHFSVSFASGYPVMTEEYRRYQELEKEFKLCTDIALDSDEKIRFVKEQITSIRNQLLSWDSSTAARVSRGTSQTAQTGSEDPTILDPLKTNTKGRPRENRFKHPAEKISRGSRGRGSNSRGRGSNSRGRGSTTRARGIRNSHAIGNDISGLGLGLGTQSSVIN